MECLFGGTQGATFERTLNLNKKLVVGTFCKFEREWEIAGWATLVSEGVNCHYLFLFDV